MRSDQRELIIIGSGAMANYLLAHLPKDLKVRAVVTTERSYESVAQQLAPRGIEVVRSIEELALSQSAPDLVVEVAGHSGVVAHAMAVVERGWNLALISIGALVEDSFRQSLFDMAAAKGSKIHLLSGAIGGMDALRAARHGGLHSVTYRGIKAVEGWRGSYAESLIDLDDLQEATPFFRGTAREAAKRFPANANVAATIGLTGLGLDETMVELIADPTSQINCHQLCVKGEFGQFEVAMEGVALPSNPGTSSLAAYSVLEACCRLLPVEN